MQNSQHQAVTLPFESMTDTELSSACYMLLGTKEGLPKRAQEELCRRFEAKADVVTVRPGKYK